MAEGVKLKAPLQVWLPFFDPAIGCDEVERDLERGQQCWRGEATHWCDPRAPEDRRFLRSKSVPVTELVFRAESLNRIDILHIGRAGGIGFDWGRRFVGPAVSGLLHEWLAIGMDSPESEQRHPRLKYVYPSPGKIDWALLFPRFTENGGIEYQPARISSFQPLSTSPTEATEDALLRRWPPKGHPPTVSPAAESHKYYGEFKNHVLKHEGRSLVVLKSAKRPKELSLPLIDRWPGTLAKLFPMGGGDDATLGAARMAQIAARSGHDPEGALIEARALAAKYTRDAVSSRLLAWCYPTLFQEGERGLLFALESEYDLPFDSLHDALASERFRETMAEKIPVTRCLGVLGLFAALLICELEAGVSLRRCERCGSVIRGRRDKRFCSAKENPACSRARHTGKRRRQRRAGKAKKEERPTRGS